MIRLDVISGFLGAGKTTFIKALIEEEVFGDEKVVILENEYGEVNMDSVFLQGTDIPVYEITKGCICCSLQDDFVATLVEIADKVKPDRVLIEPSGIFMLETLFDLLKNGLLKDSYELGQIISIVDVTLFDGRFIPMQGIIANQVKHADTVLFSKVGNSVSVELDSAKAMVRENNMNADMEVWALSDNRNSLGRYFEGVKYHTYHCHDNHCQCHHSHDHDVDNHHNHRHNEHNHQSLDSRTFKVPYDLDATDLYNFIESMKKGHFGDIIRMKGVLKVEGETRECHYTCGRFTSEKTVSQLVGDIIVIGENINVDKVTAFFSEYMLITGR